MSLYCSLAYHGIHIKTDGSLAPCSVYQSEKVIDFRQLNDYFDFRKSIHNDLEQGVKHKGCAICWAKENHNTESLRKSSNNTFEKYYDKTSIHPDDFFAVHIVYGNQGELSYITDSKVYLGLLTGSYIPVEEWWNTKEFINFINEIFSDKTVLVNIFDWDPISNNKIEPILDLIEHRRDSIEIEVTTSVARMIDSAVVHRLKEFSNIGFNVIVNGIGTKNDYLQYPTNWSTVEANIDTLLASIPNPKTKLYHPLCHASVYTLPDIVEWCKEKKLFVNVELANNIDCLDFNSVPEDDLNKLGDYINSVDDPRNRLKPQLKSQIISYIQRTWFYLNRYREFRNYVDRIDKIRGTDWNSIFLPTQINFSEFRTSNSVSWPLLIEGKFFSSGTVYQKSNWLESVTNIPAVFGLTHLLEIPVYNDTALEGILLTPMSLGVSFLFEVERKFIMSKFDSAYSAFKTYTDKTPLQALMFIAPPGMYVDYFMPEPYKLFVYHVNNKDAEDKFYTTQQLTKEHHQDNAVNIFFVFGGEDNV